MDHSESPNEGDSSTETVIGRFSSDEEQKKRQIGLSGEYKAVGDSSSSLDNATIIAGAEGGLSSNLTTGNVDTSLTKRTDRSANVKSADDDNVSETSSRHSEEKKKRRFDALKSSFRKEGGFFKMKKKNRTIEARPSMEDDVDDDDKETNRKGVGPQLEDDDEDGKTTSNLTASPSGSWKKKKRTARSLVRKLSLNKFRLSSNEQQLHLESRHTPEGGDSSQSLSQSSQESPNRHANSSYRIQKKGEEEKTPGFFTVGDELRKSEKPIEKPVSTVTVVHRKSPSLTIRSNPADGLARRNREHDSQQQPPESSVRFTSSEIQCTSTLPYAISKWPEHQQPQEISETKDDASEIFKKVKLPVKTEAESSIAEKSSSPVELRRKLSLLEEKRAIFQRRYFETTQKSGSRDTVIVTSVDKESGRSKSEVEDTRKRTRQISVGKFDTFSTFDGTFDEETGLGYLSGIKEDHTETYDQQNNEYKSRTATMGPMVGDTFEKTKSISQESTSSQNNAPTAGVAEKREHLYKILVIGELGAGKTSIIKRYVHQFFSQHYRATIGVDFALKVLNWDPYTIIRLQLWDIAGQERFGNMTRVYYKEAVGAFIVFDVTRSATLDAVVKWKQDLDSKVQLPDGSPIPCVLLANKCDQQKEGLVNSPAKMDEYCNEKNFAGWFETSAKENINIEDAARFLVNKILQNDQIMRGNGAQEQNDNERFALNQSPSISKKSCSC